MLERIIDKMEEEMEKKKTQKGYRLENTQKITLAQILLINLKRRVFK